MNKEKEEKAFSDEELNILNGYNFDKSIEIIKEKWNLNFGAIEKRTTPNKKVLGLHTGGYSDNEKIINELSTTMFWLFYWKSSSRGGHYYFVNNLVTKE